MKEIRKLYRHGGSLVLVMPGELCAKMNLQAGDRVVFLESKEPEVIRFKKLQFNSQLRVQYEQTEK